MCMLFHRHFVKALEDALGEGTDGMHLALGVELLCGFRVQTVVKFHTLPFPFQEYTEYDKHYLFLTNQGRDCFL